MNLKEPIFRHLAGALGGAACCLLWSCSPAGAGAVAGGGPAHGATPPEITAQPRDFCVRGREDPDGEALETDTVRFQVHPEGCISSGGVKRLETSCKVVSSASNQLILESRFRFVAVPQEEGGPPPLPDCGGGGWAECSAGALAPGDYTAVLGKLSVPFKVPSKTSHGSLCALPR